MSRLRRGKESGGFAWEERGEMFHEEEGAEGVDFEGFEGVGVGDLGGGFFGVEDPGEAEGEVEVVG